MLAAACVGLAGATVEVRPVVGPGATRDEALAAYGWPTGQSQSGTREILTYPQGRIFLENGRIDRVDFPPNVAWPAPRPKPAAPTATAGKKAADALGEHWTTDATAAAAEAQTRHARVLAVFLGSDWSPGSRQFEDEVANDPEFITTFVADYVFLKVDFPNRKPLPDAVRAQNTALRERYGVTTYPTLLVLSPGGALLAKVDLDNPPPGESYRTRTLASLRVVRDALTARPPAPDPEPAPGPAVAPGPEQPKTPGPASPTTTELGATLSSATWLLVLSLAGGTALVGIGLRWLWRSSPASDGRTVPAAKSAAPGPATALPALAAAAEWSKEQLCLVTGRLIEAEGFKATPRAAGSDADLTVSRTGEVSARALVVCVPAEAGRVTTKQIRELLATVTLEGAAEGWVVAPGGFAPEAHTYAAENGIVTIDTTGLTERLDALPPLARSRLLGAVS
ncbi:MAG: restriction endonuclease [Verrucomicrobia bacterium]|nr:restriction endonuclease [Verrucomicrobiota bacterium]